MPTRLPARLLSIRVRLLLGMASPAVRRVMSGWRTAGLRRVAHFVRRVLSGRVVIVRVEGRSMEPALSSGDLLLCETQPPIRALRVGDLIIMRGEVVDRGIAVKRLAGLPGDPLSIAGLGPGVVPAEHCLVLGDNVAIRGDSRVFGPQPLEYVVARVLWGERKGSPRFASTGARQRRPAEHEARVLRRSQTGPAREGP